MKKGENMSAKEMFGKSGYNQYIDGNIIRYFNEEIRISVYFNIPRKLYTAHSMGNAPMIDIDLHNAINQQLKELKWID